MEDKKCEKCLWIAAYSNQSRTVSDTRGRQSVGWYVRQDGDAWVTNAVVSTIALPFWAYLMGAVAFAPYHDGNLAAILVMSFTVVSGLVARHGPTNPSSANSRRRSLLRNGCRRSLLRNGCRRWPLRNGRALSMFWPGENARDLAGR